MQEITEEKIAAMAPNQAAAANGKKISRGGGFVRLEHSADDTFYMGECKGSGKSNYITSVDFIEQYKGRKPVRADSFRVNMGLPFCMR